MLAACVSARNIACIVNSPIATTSVVDENVRSPYSDMVGVDIADGEIVDALVL
jgi:hypothetical protein